MPTAFSMRDAICPQATQNYVTFSRADGMAHSPEKVASLGGIRG
jgi:hypothetical protein